MSKNVFPNAVIIFSLARLISIIILFVEMIDPYSFTLYLCDNFCMVNIVFHKNY